MAVITNAEAGLRAIGRGASILQLRAPELSARDLEREAAVLVPKSSVPVIISSRCDIAVAVGAAGVNLPERDIGVGHARQMLGQRLIGRSVHTQAAARQAEAEGADFVIFGPVWSSPSHEQEGAQGLDALIEVVRSVGIPVLAIGGVDAERAQQCVAAGAGGYAAIRMFA